MQIPSKDYNVTVQEQNDPSDIFFVCDDDDSTLVAKTPTSFVGE
jgi:hypothetical protein